MCSLSVIGKKKNIFTYILHIVLGIDQKTFLVSFVMYVYEIPGRNS